MSDFTRFAIVMAPYVIGSAAVICGCFYAIHREEKRRKALRKGQP